MKFEKSIFIPSASILAKIQCAVVTMKSENTIVRIYYKWVFFLNYKKLLMNSELTSLADV